MTETSQQRVVITAAANGIGLAVAEEFTRAGARVHICDIDASGVQEVSERNPLVTGQVCDVADQADVEHFIAGAVETMGGIDVLVNNAGIAGRTAPIEEFPVEEWRKVVDVNLIGTFLVTRAAIPHLKKSEAGSVIFMSSLAGRFGYPNRSPYAATKRAIISLTETVGMELGVHGVRSNAIAPGAVEGERMDQVLEGRATAAGISLEEATEQAYQNQSLKRFVDPADIGRTAVFLASPAAKSISGQTIAIDGQSRSTQ